MGRYWVGGERPLANNEWITPQWLLMCLGSEFELDPCAAYDRPWPIAAHHLTPQDDGLARQWHGRVWLNPPYGRGLDLWLNRLALHGDGIAILPFRSTDAAWFHRAIWASASAVLFVRGRIRFCHKDGSTGGPCPHASLLVAYGTTNADRLKASGIVGKYLLLPVVPRLTRPTRSAFRLMLTRPTRSTFKLTRPVA